MKVVKAEIVFTPYSVEIESGAEHSLMLRILGAASTQGAQIETREFARNMRTAIESR